MGQVRNLSSLAFVPKHAPPSVSDIHTLQSFINSSAKLFVLTGLVDNVHWLDAHFIKLCACQPAKINVYICDLRCRSVNRKWNPWLSFGRGRFVCSLQSPPYENSRISILPWSPKAILGPKFFWVATLRSLETECSTYHTKQVGIFGGIQRTYNPKCGRASSKSRLPECHRATWNGSSSHLPPMRLSNQSTRLSKYFAELEWTPRSKAKYWWYSSWRRCRPCTGESTIKFTTYCLWFRNKIKICYTRNILSTSSLLWFNWQEAVDKFTIPTCPKCSSGALKPHIVFFGDNVPRGRVDKIYGWYRFNFTFCTFAGFDSCK